jgi:hypothetical protein
MGKMPSSWPIHASFANVGDNGGFAASCSSLSVGAAGRKEGISPHVPFWIIWFIFCKLAAVF